ncbi:hypothetical protein F5141DRAFT_1000055, partial [Pisolithus sp. B1]
HAMLRNDIKHNFRVIKQCFCALILPPKYNMTIQSQLPATACCIHNIIHLHDPDDVDIPDPD